MKNAPNMIMRKSTGLAARTTWKRKENQFFIFFQSAKMNSDGKKDTSTLKWLHNEFQMADANHYFMALIQSKTVQFSFFSEFFLENQWVQMGFSENRRVQLHPLHPL